MHVALEGQAFQTHVENLLKSDKIDNAIKNAWLEAREASMKYKDQILQGDFEGDIPPHSQRTSNHRAR